MESLIAGALVVIANDIENKRPSDPQVSSSFQDARGTPGDTCKPARLRLYMPPQRHCATAASRPAWIVPYHQTVLHANAGKVPHEQMLTQCS